jgi:hypothetical protein
MFGGGVLNDAVAVVLALVLALALASASTLLFLLLSLLLVVTAFWVRLLSLSWSSLISTTTSLLAEEVSDVALEDTSSCRKRWKAHSDGLRFILDDSSNCPVPDGSGGDQNWSEISSTENTLSIIPLCFSNLSLSLPLSVSLLLHFSPASTNFRMILSGLLTWLWIWWGLQV